MPEISIFYIYNNETTHTNLYIGNYYIPAQRPELILLTTADNCFRLGSITLFLVMGGEGGGGGGVGGICDDEDPSAASILFASCRGVKIAPPKDTGC